MASMKTMLVSVFDVGVTMDGSLCGGTTSKRRMIASFLSRPVVLIIFSDEIFSAV